MTEVGGRRSEVRIEQALVRQVREQHSWPMNQVRVGLCAAAFLALGLCANAQPESSGAAIAQIAKEFDKHPLIMIGELHRWEQLHAFMREMMRNPEFVCRADDIVVEFGNSRLQGLADKFAAGEKLSETELQSLWRENSVPLTWN